MPKKLHDCVEKVKNKGKSEDSAWAICTDAMKKGKKKPRKKKK